MRSLLVLLTVCGFALAAAAGDPGSAGLLSLRLGMGARHGAMAETGAANGEDANAIYWNPAGMALLDGTQISLQHMEYLGLFRAESFALAHATPYGNFGLLVSGFYSDELERTAAEPAGVPQGTFQPYDLVAGAGYARRVGEFGVGLLVKMVYQRIDLYDGLGLAFDLGVQHRTRIEGLTLGASVANLGPDFELDGGSSYPLPRLIRGGAAYTLEGDLLPGLGRVQLATDILLPNDGNGRLHLGAEAWLHESFAVRGGHRFNYETAGPSFGAGFRRGPLRVDYAFLHADNDFDPTHRFSLEIALRP